MMLLTRTTYQYTSAATKCKTAKAVLNSSQLPITDRLNSMLSMYPNLPVTSVLMQTICLVTSQFSYFHDSAISFCWL